MIASARATAAALFLSLLAGCAGSGSDEAGTSAGAATGPTERGIAGYYSGHMRGWDGSLSITNATPESVAFDFDISPDDVSSAPIGRLTGTATRTERGYEYVDDRCTVVFEPVTDGPSGARGDVFVDAALQCAINLGLDGHSTVATALDFTATWRRVGD